jgi:hypothetical protein
MREECAAFAKAVDAVDIGDGWWTGLQEKQKARPSHVAENWAGEESET